MEPKQRVPDPSTIVDVLGTRARRQPDRQIYTFLQDGETEAAGLTFGALDRRSRAIGGALQACANQGDRVLLLLPPGPEFITAFLGCLYAGVIAVPAYPPSRRKPEARLQALAADAAPRVVLTTTALLPRVRPALAGVPGLERALWIAVEELAGHDAGRLREAGLTGDSIAFLQYTSGSTSSPKGVMVSHDNLLHNERIIQQAFGQSEESVVVGWLPLYHDMGLIGTVLQPLYTGARCVLMSPVAFLQQPVRWLRSISRYRATTSGGPNFAYDLCVRKVSPEQAAELDLSSWSVAFNGAEPVRRETLDRFAETFASRGFRRQAFYPCYGLAEATLFVAGAAASGAAGEGEAGRRVAYGTEWEGQRLAIVDPASGAECAPGREGEIWVAGPSVAAGYWGRPEESAETFRATLAGAAGDTGPYLRTGDLGYVDGGELVVTGRLKDLIILRGRNHYPQDLELTVERSHPALRPGCGASFSVEVEGEERLVVLQEVDRHAARLDALEAITEAIRDAVAREHEVRIHEVVLLRAGGVLKTSSGKVQRRACRAAYLAGGLPAVARSVLAGPLAAAEEEAGEPSFGLEERIALPPEQRATVLAELLRAAAARALSVPRTSLDPTQPLTACGLDSLSAAELKQDIESRTGLSVALPDLLQGISLEGLASSLLAGGATATGSAGDEDLPPAPGEEQPLSWGQRALWFLQSREPESAAYNLAAAAVTRSPLDAGALRRALEALVARHAALRTTFGELRGEPFQRVREDMELDFGIEHAPGATDEELQPRLRAEAFRPFDLTAGPPLRVRVWETAADRHVVLWVVHHIAADFTSMALLLRDLDRLYLGAAGRVSPALPPLAWGYSDFVRWQERHLAGEAGERSWRYWRERLAGEPAPLALPTDRPRPPVLSDRGATLALRLGPEAVGRLRELGRSHGATLFTVLLAAFQTLLHRHSGQLDVAVGSPAAGRTHRRFAGLVGYFVQPVVLRADFTGDPPAAGLLRRTRENVAGALEHQDFPFPLLVERLQPERQAGRSPLFQAMFVFYRGQPAGGRLSGMAALALGEAGARIEVGGMELESLALGESRVQLDLTLAVAETGEAGETGETGGGLLASFQYSRDLFDASSIALMRGHLEVLLAGLAEDAARPVGDLPLLTAAERSQLLAWNAPGESAPDGCLHELFEGQAARTPEAEALVAGGERLTYAELDRRATRLAHRLRARGVRPESAVGVYLARSADLVTALLAVLKAGGAYLPLDPAYPGERLSLLLEDAGAQVLVTHEALIDWLPRRPGRVVLVGEEEPEPAAGSPSGAALPGNLAYLIYTSGSTGRPKGVAVAHRNAVALVRWARQAFSDRELAGVLASTSAAFDLSVFELFVPLAYGGRVILAGNAIELASLGEVPEVTLVNTVPSAIAELIELGALASGAVTVNLAGEALTSGLVRRLHEQPAVRRLLNLYGPSETTTYSTFAVLPPGEEGIPPIGRPIAGTRVYLLDAGLRPVPFGAAGEAYIGGDGVSRGYHARPDLTAERFVPDPFSPVPGERLYRTGDLARRQPDGDLEYLGRLDDQVKIRGFRVEPGEVQAALTAHPEVREAVVLALAGAGGERRLAAWVVATGGVAPSTAELRRYLRERLPDSMVPADLVCLESLPLTVNGKVDRRALAAMSVEPAAGLPDRVRAYEPPRHPVEEVLAGLWADLLGVGRVGIHDGFFDLGGHSLLAARVVARVREALGVELPLSWVFAWPTVAELAGEVERARTAKTAGAAPPLQSGPRPGPRPAEIPLSFAQESLWFLDRLAPGQAVYNLPVAVRLSGPLSIPALHLALARVVARHEALRTTFATGPAGPFQRIAAEVRTALPVADLSALPAAAQRREGSALAGAWADRPFDLAAGPLLRAGLLRLGPHEHAFLLTLHHTVADGWSLALLLREVETVYRAVLEGHFSPLAPLPVQYADFALWQRGRLTGPVLDRELAWWRDSLAGAPFELELPADHPRPPRQSHRGACRSLRLPTRLTQDLAALGRRQGATFFMVILAAVQTLLSRLSGQDEVLVGTPAAHRTRVELEGLIGLFVNTLVLRGDLSGEPPFSELLARVRDSSLAVFAHQDVPFEKLVEELAPERSLARPPLFQVMLALQNAPAAGLDLPGLVAERLAAGDRPEKFDLTLTVTEESDGLLVELSLALDLFDPATGARLLDGFARLLTAAGEDPSRLVHDLPLLAAAEEQQILVDWNATDAPFPRHLGLHELFEAQAARTPHETALIHGTERVSYGELDAWADRLAGRLRALGVEPEVLVGVFCGRTPGMVAAVLAVLKAGGAYLPLDPAYPADRLSFLLADSGAPVVLTEEAVAAALPAFAGTRVLVDRDAAGLGAEERPRGFLHPAQAAYVIYTSGSTGVPKGVLVRHGSAVARVAWALAAYPPEVLAGVLAATSLCFDLSVFEIFVPLAAGGAVILAEDALALPGLPAAAAVTLVNTVPSAMTELERAGALPRSVRVVNLAGEPLRRDLAVRLHALPGVEEVHNLYGPTEDTTYSTAARIERDIARDDGREPAIGRPLANTRAYVLAAGLRPLLRPVPVGASGELWLAGEGLARGYLRRPELTADRFRPDPFGPPSGRLYRTGDRARWRPDGTLEVLGRLDHQVKVRGFRIELGEVEAALLALAGVREAVVVAREDRLVAYWVGDTGADALRRSLREHLPGFMLPALYVTLAALPRTPNGKVDRKALPAPEWQGDEESDRAPRTPVEEILADIWAELLGVERVGTAGQFFHLGGHSLLATQVMSRLRQAFGIEVPLRDLFEAPRLEDFAARVAARVDAARRTGASHPAPPLVPRAPETRGEPLPLSPAQQRLWLIDQLDPGQALYNIAAALRAEGPLDPAVLALSLGEVVRRHEALRTVFRGVLEGVPVQSIQPAAPFALAVADLSELPARGATALALAGQEAGRPFDLAGGPLLRGLLLRLGAEEQIVLLTLHHIAGDGWSMGILVRELTALYAAFAEGRPSPLPELPLQYADFSAWQHSWLHGAALESEVAYWRRQLAGLPPRLELPTDRPRPAAQRFHGASQPVRLPAELTRRLQALGRREGATLFMVLLAGFQALLGRYSGQQDLAVGTPIAGRNRVETEGLIGFFVNTLVLRGDLAGEPSFRELLARARETALDAHTHQDVPFDKLVQELSPERSLAHAPLFQVMLALQNLPAGTIEMGSLVLTPLEVDTGAAKFDLSLTLEERAGELAGSLRYATDLFDRTTVLRLVDHLERLLTTAAAAPERRLAELEIFSAAQRAQLLVEWNDTSQEVPALPVHRLFLREAERTPAAVAVRTDGGDLTYGELAARVCAWAGHLRALGAGPEQVVAVCLERSADLVTALLAVLASGAAYLPLDPRDPEERRAQILADAGPLLLLTRSALNEGSGNSGTVHTLHVESLPAVADGTVPPAEWPAPAGALAYVLYTSGSTGRPKGVAVDHANLSGYLAWIAGLLAEAGVRWLPWLSAVTFDASLKQLFAPLLRGEAVRVISEDALLRPVRLLEILGEAPGAGCNTVPTLWEGLLGALERGEAPPPADLRALFLGGERLPEELAARTRRLLPGVALYNLYGPTEATSNAAWSRLPAAGESGEVGRVVLGRPVGGAHIVLLDPNLWPVPLGATGELCAGGAGVARGYRGRPGLTAERFVPDPFGGGSGARLYRTGDLARRLPDGSLDFLGRLDDQVKIRGFRIELGEIEAVLEEHPGVRVAAVLACADGLGERRLVAYVASGEEAPGTGDLRSHLERRLPAYMVPSAFKVRAELPCTSHGKIDRPALAALGDPFEDRESGAMPVTPLEKVLAGMIAEVLGLQGGVGLHDNFFELGGHSMRAVELVGRLREAFGIEVSLFHVFDAPTVADLAGVLLESPEWGRTVEELAPALLQFLEPPAEPMGGAGREEKR